MPQSMHLFLVPIFIVCCAVTSSAQTPWPQISDSEAGFTIRFPGQPTYQTTVDPVTGQQIEIYKFFFTRHLLRITYALLPSSIRSAGEISKVYSDFARQVVPAGGALLRQQKLPDGGRQYDTVVDTKDGPIYGRTRFYVRNSRYYAIAFEMYAKDGINEQEAERFFSSFNFIDAQSGRKANNNIDARNGMVLGKSANAKWYMFRTTDNDFKVEFPGKPIYQLDTSTESTPLHRYYYFQGENIFQITYQEIQEVRAQPEQALRRAVDNYSSPRKGWRVLGKVQLPDGGYEVRSRGVSDSVLVYSRTRIYARGARIYYVSTLTQNLYGPNKADIDRFFDSFGLL